MTFQVTCDWQPSQNFLHCLLLMLFKLLKQKHREAYIYLVRESLNAIANWNRLVASEQNVRRKVGDGVDTNLGSYD